MAVLGRLLISSAERLDLPDLLSIDSYTAGDFKFLLKSFVGSDKPFVLKGFDVIDPELAIGSQSCSIRVADSVVYFPTSNSGSFFYGLEEGNVNAQPLVPELRKNATNYVYLTLSTSNTSVDSRAFWDPDKDSGVGGEFSQDVNTESVLNASINVSTGSFPENVIPIAKIVVGPVVITRIEDTRDMMFRLGSGGVSPDPYNQYGWRALPDAGHAREEPPISMSSPSDPNPFQGGDKNIQTLKEWMDAVMTKLLELGGTNFWYEDTSSYSLISLFFDAVNSTFKSKGQWQHSSSTPGLVTWTEDIIIQGAGDPRNYIIRAGNKTLADEQVAYLSLVRAQELNSFDLPVSWVNGQNYVNTVGGAVGLFENLAKGDWIRKASDGNHLFVRVEEFYDAVNLGGSTTTAALAKSVRLNTTYQGSTAEEKGRYDQGVYLASDVTVDDRDSSALSAAGGNYHWMAMRSDTIQNIGSIDSFALSGTLSQADGSTVRASVTGHGLSDGDWIQVTAPVAQAGTYQIEVEDANTFYIQSTNTTVGALTAFYGLSTTVARDNGYGLQLESANHGFDTGETVIIDGTSNYDGSYVINKRSATQFQFAFGSNQAAESTGTATLARVNVRSQQGMVKIVQGESINIGEPDTKNIQSFVGMNSLAEVHPLYYVPVSYDTLDGMANYNSDVTDNLTARASKLTAMMADKAQDKEIIFGGEGYTGVTNTTNGADQDITFVGGSAQLNTILSGSPGNCTVGLTGTLSLAANEGAYWEIDRNASSSIADLSGLTVVPIDEIPIDENVMVFAVRLSGTTVWLWDGTEVPLGGIAIPGAGLTKVDLYDLATVVLPTVAPYIIDGETLADGDTVLFSNLAVGNNTIYQASVVGLVISWTALNKFDGNFAASDGDTVIIRRGDGFADQIGKYTGTEWDFNKIIRHFNGADYWEESAQISSTLVAATTGDVFTVNPAGSENWIINFSLLRGSVKEVGTIYLVTDGSTASCQTDSTYIGSSGITFSADINAGLLRLRYTATAGVNADMRYHYERWSDSAGGPSGVPNYTGFAGGGSAGGANSEIQYNNGGSLAGDPDFVWDNVTKEVGMNGLKISVLQGPATLLDNTASPTNIFTYTAATYRFAIIEYSIERNTDFEVGRLLIANNGTIVSITDDSTATAPTGIDFSAAVNGADIEVKYTSTSTGFNASMKYSMRRWS